jgi:hypothetical protein
MPEGRHGLKRRLFGLPSSSAGPVQQNGPLECGHVLLHVNRLAHLWFA